MLAYSELRTAIDWLLQTGLVTRVYHDVVILLSTDGKNRYPAYKEGDEFIYVGVDDTKKMNCYIRQTSDVEKIERLKISSCSKAYKCRIQYRIVFFNDFETRAFDDLHEKILQIASFRNIELSRLITDTQKLLREESQVKGFNFGATTFYCGLDVFVTFNLMLDKCDVPIGCDEIGNPIETRAPIVYRTELELDPVWEQEKVNYYTKAQILSLMGIDAGEGSIPLIVTASGQTQFNIFTEPPNDQHYLTVNGVEFSWENGDYSIQNISGWKLVWLNTDFQLDLDDELIFFKY